MANIDTITVTAPRESGDTTGSSSFLWSCFISTADFGGTKGGMVSDSEGPADDPVSGDDAYEAARNYLLANQEFISLPSAVQNTILSLYVATTSLANLLQSGLIREISIGSLPTGVAAQFYANTSTLMINVYLSNDLMSGSPSAQRELLGVLGHEFGHAATPDDLKIDYTSRDAYIASRIEREAAAIVNNMYFWHVGLMEGVGVSTSFGGNANGAYENMYESFLQNGDMDAFMASIKHHLQQYSRYPEIFGDEYDQRFPNGP